MKKWTALLLAWILLMGLCACSASGDGKPGQERDRERLESLLDDIAENVHPGTAGNGLTAVRIAADLVSWAASTEMSKTEAAAVVGSWLKKQTPELRESFREQLEQVSQAYEKLTLEDAKDFLESAGVQKEISKLTDKMQEIAGTILEAGK